jgi:hypothetical protein
MSENDVLQLWLFMGACPFPSVPAELHLFPAVFLSAVSLLFVDNKYVLNKIIEVRCR